MSKTTPEEARKLAHKHGLYFYDNAEEHHIELAALIDEVRGVDAGPVAIPADCKKEWAEYVRTIYLNARTSSVTAHIPSHAIEAVRDILIAASHPAPSQPAAPVELPVVGNEILRFLDELGDDAIAHIWPEDLEKCCRSECIVKVYSVRMGGSDGSHTIPLFSREQVGAAIAAGRKAS